MEFIGRIVPAGGIVAAILAIAALWPNKTVLAEQAASKPPSPLTSSAPGSLDANLFKIPQAAPIGDFDKLKFGKSRQETPEFALSDRIDLGSHVLRFDTSRSAVDSIPRVGIDNADPSLLNQAMPGAKSSPMMPSYFGLTFTTPTH
jgi:hypothetical protein